MPLNGNISDQNTLIESALPFMQIVAPAIIHESDPTSEKRMTNVKNILTLLKKPNKFLAHLGVKLAYQFRLTQVPVLPTTLDIEPNNWCNFRCDHCQVTHWKKPKSQLDVKRFSYITNQFPNLTQVKVQGMGEPFLNKSTIGMLEYLDQRGIASHTISNGSVLTEKLSKKLSRLKHCSIGFSLDGGTRETFEGIRIRGNFEKVTDNVKSLLKVATNLDAKFWVVVSNENYHECEDIVNLAKRVGVSKVTFQTFMTDWGKDDMKDQISHKTVAEPNNIEFIDKAMKAGKTKGIEVNRFKGYQFTAKKPCQWPWTSMMIDASGYVIPCCVIADSDTINFGNVFEQKIEKIWNSDQYKDFRKSHADGNIPDLCKACYKQS